MFIAFDRITIALALLGFYTYPAMVAVANVALGRERLDRTRVIALGLAIARHDRGRGVATGSGRRHPARRDRHRPGPRRGGQPDHVRGHQPRRLLRGPDGAGDGDRDAGHRPGIRGSRALQRGRALARVSADGAGRAAAAAVHGHLRGGHPVARVPDRDPRDRRDAGRHPHAVRAGRRRGARGVAPQRSPGADPARGRGGHPGGGPRCCSGRRAAPDERTGPSVVPGGP